MYFGCIPLVQNYAFMNEYKLLSKNILSYIYMNERICLDISQIKDLSTNTKHVHLRQKWFCRQISCLTFFIFPSPVTNIWDKYQVWIFGGTNGSLHIPVCCEAFQFSHSSVPICSLFWSSKMNLEYSKDLELLPEWLFEEIKLKIQIPSFYFTASNPIPC